METCRNRKIGRTLRAICGLAAISAVTAGAMADDNKTAAKSNDLAQVMAQAAEFSVKEDYNKTAFVQNLPSAPGTRGSPPFPGGGCQTQNPVNGFNYGLLFHAADNFNAGSTGQINSVSWSAVYRAGTTTLTDGTPPATETFTIRFLADNAGVPGAPLANGVHTVSTPAVIRTNSGTFLGTAPALTIWDYQITGLAGPNVTAGTCYWIEIQNTSTLVAPTNVSFWVSANQIPGDNIIYVDDTPSNISNCGEYDVADQGAGDLTFCLNIPLNDASTCVPANPFIGCQNSTNNAANGTGVDSASNVGFNSASEGSLYPATITGVFQRAEQFSVTTAGNLQAVCFWGFFLGTGLTANSCARDFDVIVWNNNNVNGQPGTIRNPGGVGARVGTTAGVTLTRALDISGDELFTVNLGTANQVPLNANTCYHLTISNQFDTANAARSARFVWGSTPAAANTNPARNNSFWSRAIPSGGVAGAWAVTAAAADNRFNMAYQLNVGPAGAPTCVPPPPGNDTCATAAVLPLNGTVVNGSNVNGTAEALPGCGFSLVEGATVWYTFVGTGNDVTISTCNASTPTLDTIIACYCATDCTGPFTCVGGNDDDATPCGLNGVASAVTIPTVNGQNYYVVVYGFGGNQDVFGVSATQGAASVNPPSCASQARCELSAAPFDVQETDACGAGTGLDNNNTCLTASAYPVLGNIAAGTVSTTGAFRDIDLWLLPAAAAGTNVSLFLNSEFPSLCQFLNDADGCAGAGGFTVVDGFGATFCIGLDVLLIDVALPATGDNVFLITVPSFDGAPCGVAPNSTNDYRFQITTAVVGACCVPTFACQETTLTDCAAQGGTTWTANLACTPNDPCDGTAPGKCCFPDGTCSLVPSVATANASACTTAGGTYTAGGVCEPNTCMAGGMGACCQGSTCTSTTAAGCVTGPNQVFAGVNTTCNVFPAATTPCCLADYNHVGGITVQDIFDFLNGYFGSSPLANINGGSLSVQDIFDFLNAYFAAGC